MVGTVLAGEAFGDAAGLPGGGFVTDALEGFNLKTTMGKWNRR
jgi:hypothetical protein